MEEQLSIAGLVSLLLVGFFLFGFIIGKEQELKKHNKYLEELKAKLLSNSSEET